MKKPTLLIVIDNLRKGGAEILLVGILADLNKKFDVVLATLSGECDFSDEEILVKEKYVLGFRNKSDLVIAASRLKKIIRQMQPSLIHSHLFYSSLVARWTCPSDIPLIYSLHGEMSKNVFNNSKLLTFLEKKTIKRNHAVMAVSDGVLKDYENSIGKNHSTFVLKNYISDVYFNQSDVARNYENFQELKLVAVGNIKKAKNYDFLIEAFCELKNYQVSLHIYGDGSEEDFKRLRREVAKNNLPISFKGPSDNIPEQIHMYDLFVSSSLHEGFGMAVVEAMASGLPLLLSDLPILDEVTHGNALFFDVTNRASFVNLIQEIFERRFELNKLSRKGIEIAKKYSKEIYLENLFSIYNEILTGASNKLQLEIENKNC